MKVLSIKEPYATLIATGKKKIETRSFKTNYRGELYIHASGKIQTKLPKEKEFSSLYQKENLHPGYILCKCVLTDCILMDEEFIQQVKETNFEEYLCGDYQVGRYAWVLDKVEVLPTFFFVKGRLGIWNYEKKENQNE